MSKPAPTVEKAIQGEIVHNEDPDLVDEKASRFGDALNVVPLPESLRGKSEDELKKMRRKATMKLDAVILTGVVISEPTSLVPFPNFVLNVLLLVYILNYLDRQNIRLVLLESSMKILF